MGYKHRGLYPVCGGGGGGLIMGIDCKSASNKVGVVLIKTRFAFTGFH